MKGQIQTLTQEFEAALSQANTSPALYDLKVQFLGKKGQVAALMLALKDVSKEERPLLGKEINSLKQRISSRIEESLALILDQEQKNKLEREKIDTSLPANQRHLGKEHLISQMLDRVLEVLIGMGFTVQYTPELESEYYNYGGLNYEDDHPARDMQDTYYVTEDVLLRSHTTNFQIRAMEEYEPPIRMVAPGKCYRNETISMRSHVLFHQVDVLYIDKHVSFADLLATQEEFYSKLFDQKIELRVRPSYFPFVEPGIEVDINCIACSGKGCKICKHTGWLEVAGAGMVHSNVLKAGNLDPSKFQGYAWGMGIERVAMLKYGIRDIRLFLENDMRFLSQFP